jgi:AcrR family transcriptional regulator
MAQEEHTGLEGEGLMDRTSLLWERERLLNAMVEEVAASGFQATSIASLSARARLPEEVFAAHFADEEDCFLQAFDSLIVQLAARTICAYHAPHDSWIGRIRAGLSTYIAGVCSRPQAARAYLLEASTIGVAARAQRNEAVALLEDTVAEMLEDLPTGAQLSPMTVTAIAGGIARVVERRLREGRAAELPGLVEDMLAWALMYVPEAERIPEARELVADGAERGLALLR